MGRRRAAVVAQEWRDAVRTHHGKWWYIVRKDRFPWQYWNQEYGHFVGFYGSASRYRTQTKAEKFAFLIISKDPNLIGVVDVHSPRRIKVNGVQ
jgi:hypothetical protein